MNVYDLVGWISGVILPVSIHDLIGCIGGVVLLASIYAASSGRIPATGKLFNWMQVSGAVLIAVSLLPAQAWPTITLEACFMAISLRAIFKKKK